MFWEIKVRKIMRTFQIQFLYMGKFPHEEIHTIDMCISLSRQAYDHL